MTDPETRAFLAQFEQARLDFEAWPQWMKDAAHVASARLPRASDPAAASQDGYFEVSAGRRGWRGGDYNGSPSWETRVWRFPTRAAADEFVARGGTKGYVEPWVRPVAWDSLPAGAAGLTAAAD